MKEFTFKKATYEEIGRLVFKGISNRTMQMRLSECYPTIKNWLKDLGVSFSDDEAEECTIDGAWYDSHSTIGYHIDAFYNGKPRHIKLKFDYNGDPETLCVYVQTAEPQITPKND